MPVPVEAAELHIASLVVQAVAADTASVAAAIAQLPGSEVHAMSPQGKLIVTLEAASADEMLAAITLIQRSPGVLTAALVYQCADTLATMNEEIPDVPDVDPTP